MLREADTNRGSQPPFVQVFGGALLIFMGVVCALLAGLLFLSSVYNYATTASSGLVLSGLVVLVLMLFGIGVFFYIVGKNLLDKKVDS